MVLPARWAEDGLDQLQEFSYTVVRLRPEQVTPVRLAVTLCRDLLQGGRSGVDRVALIDSHRRAWVSHFTEKSQIRMERHGASRPRPNAIRVLGDMCQRLCLCGSCGTCSPSGGETGRQLSEGSSASENVDDDARPPGLSEHAVLEALDDAWNALQEVAAICMPPRLDTLLPQSSGPTESVIDAFYYPDHELHEITCAAHDDPGLVTIVAADSPGLEVHDPTNGWMALNLGPEDVAIITGKTWAKFDKLTSTSNGVSSCRHRVRALQRGDRCSVAFEVRPGRDGQLALAQAEGRAMLASSS